MNDRVDQLEREVEAARESAVASAAALKEHLSPGAVAGEVMRSTGAARMATAAMPLIVFALTTLIMLRLRR